MKLKERLIVILKRKGMRRAERGDLDQSYGIHGNLEFWGYYTHLITLIATTLLVLILPQVTYESFYKINSFTLP